MTKEQKVKKDDLNESFFSPKIAKGLDKIMRMIDSEKKMAILVDEGTSDELFIAFREFRKATKRLRIMMPDKVTLGPKGPKASYDTNLFLDKLAKSLVVIVLAIDSEVKEAIPTDNSAMTGTHFVSKDLANTDTVKFTLTTWRSKGMRYALNDFNTSAKQLHIAILKTIDDKGTES